MHEQIQKDGAKARTEGATPADNPYYKPENMPAATGETIPEWEAKACAWNFGWMMGEPQYR